MFLFSAIEYSKTPDTETEEPIKLTNNKISFHL